MQDKDNGTKRVAIVGPSGISGSTRAALTLLATTHCWDFEIVDCNEQLKAYAKAMRGAEKELESLRRQQQLLIRDEIPWELKIEYGAHLNFEEQQKLKTKGCRSKQRRKW